MSSQLFIIFFVSILGLQPFTAYSQQSSFTILITDSLGKTIPENQLKDIRETRPTLQLNFKRAPADKNSYGVYVFQYNEKNRKASMLVPASSNNREGLPIKANDSVLTIPLVRVDMQKPDSIRLAVIVATGFNFFYSTMNNLVDTTWDKYSWLQPKRDSLFNSFHHMLGSDLEAIPNLEELENLVSTKTDNLQYVESDLTFAWDCRRSELCFKELIDFNAKEINGKILSSYSYIRPVKSSLLLSWSKASGLIMQPGKKTEMDRMIEGAAEKHLKLSRSRGSEPRPSEYLKFSLKELVATLGGWPKKTGLLLYSLDSSGLKILYADNKKKTDTVLIPLKKERLFLLADQLQSLLNPGTGDGKLIASRGLGTTSKTRPGTVDSLARIISQLLLPKKFDLSTLDHLVIIPSFNIGSFPFAMLPVKDSLLLIDQMSYSIVPSINEFIIGGEMRKKHFDNSRGSLFKIEDGQVYWSYDRPFLFVGSPAANKIGSYNFSALPGAKKEIEELSKNVPNPVILMDKDAVKPKVTSAMKNADVIYFATHAVADAIDPLNKSFILLSGKNADATLSAKEIQQLDLRASLVILSACETGLGKSHEGGMIGLSRAFEIAGAKNVLMSLWPVSDSKTPKLMKYFFEALENNGNGHIFFPHEAFRQAILKFKKEQKDPVYWAAFSLFGVPL